MTKSLDLSILENLSAEDSNKNLNLIGKALLDQIKDYLELDPYFEKVEISVVNNISENFPKFEDIFTIGVNRVFKNDTVAVEVYSEYEKYYPFILLRELYNIFVPLEIINYESIQLVINQILLVDLEKNQHVNEWRSLIRGNIEQYDLLSTGINRLTAFDRISNFFKLVQMKLNPTKFFFHYIRENLSIINDKLESRELDVHIIFFEEFEKEISKELANDEIIETIRCLNVIFNKTKKFQNLLSYKNLFQKFKENYQLSTDLSLRKFMKNMDWIKNSVLAPSYNINYPAMNLVPLQVYFRFHPLLEKAKIFKIIENFPFIINSTFSMKTFGLDIFAIFIIPKPYFKDIINFIEKLVNFSYIISYTCLSQEHVSMNNNLNYHRKYMQNKIFINPKNVKYDKKKEVETIANYGSIFYNPKLNLLDFLILDRIQWYSVTGLGFERRNDILNSIKLDLLNEIITERTKIKDLKHELNTLQNSEALREDILFFIEKNKNFGFFYIKQMLQDYLSLILLVEKFLSKNQQVKNLYQFQKVLRKGNITYSIEKNLLLNKSPHRNTIIREVASLYFSSNKSYETYLKKIKKFNRIFSLFSNLKLYNLDSIKKILTNQYLIKNILKTKEEKLKQSYEKYKSYQITNQKIDLIIDKFLDNDPPLIIPKLLKTLPPPYNINDYYIMFIARSSKNMSKLKNLEKFFPLFDIRVNSKIGLINVEIHLPFLTNNEKSELLSILYNIFKEDLLLTDSFLYSGYHSAFSMKSFYDYDKEQFFYTKDIFEQFSLYTKHIFGNELKPLNNIPFKSQEKLWGNKEDIMELVKNVNSRSMSENNIFNKEHLNKLVQFNSKFQNILLNSNEFKKTKQSFFFKNYVKSIRFIPALHYFGLDQYFLYFYPNDLNRIDLKLLLLNTFQNIKHTISIGASNSFLIKYIMPYDRPNRSYLNHIAKSEKTVREYCLFSIKKVYTFIQFDYNLTQEGWNYNTDKFKIYVQNILFDSNYKIHHPSIKEFRVFNKTISSYFGPKSPEYKALSEVYGKKSLDIKSYMGTKNYNIINALKMLLERGIIFPLLKLKNLNLHNKIVIILPNLKKQINKKIIDIISFFNYGFIYEIKGEYFIQGFTGEFKFNNGLMIKLYLPMFKHHEFIGIFKLLFEYLAVKDYLILTDLVKSETLLKSIYGNFDFNNLYNPLKNLEWDEKDLIWMNHKLFSERFHKIYPPLTYEFND
ncbi:MAG: hypothetical protein ACFFEO_15290 [Candidatus Thorarchaeota archaeon]